ncbi:DUF1000-domain-containing protein [Sistotremastrum suecicum HHB10207 ss-3]|uniref:DUF1000-domain-containing protein n=1 Tax=Sistotremastrum suecicum HHB10207 ss-3 TaxID=1314776 RepID=A0A166GZM1_9AGAM|nr:DUF1000-domain-containing protein [Sistotremastrum suecicum HHB10207 ss-3]
MSHNHDHNCADEHHEHGHGDHDHDHDHASAEGGSSDNLFSKIDQSNVVALNATVPSPVKVCKPWHQRLDEEEYLESDADDQLILHVPFTGSVKLLSILLKTGPGDQTPSKVCVLSNAENLDFDDIASKPPVQEFEIVQSRDVGEYTVKAAKFPNVSSITLFFPSSQGADSVRLYYVGFRGIWTERKEDPVITVYEATANLADHTKIQGTDGSFSTPQT